MRGKQVSRIYEIDAISYTKNIKIKASVAPFFLKMEIPDQYNIMRKIYLKESDLRGLIAILKQELNRLSVDRHNYEMYEKRHWLWSIDV